MNRLLRVGMTVLSALAIGAGVAVAAQSPDGPLGRPDSHGRTEGTFTKPLLVPTGSCVGFAPGDTLSVTGVSYSGQYKYWIDTSWRDVDVKLSGSTTTGGLTYEIRGHLENFSSFWSDMAMGAGNVTISRSDGARMMNGTANVTVIPLSGINEFRYQLTWWETPTCK